MITGMVTLSVRRQLLNNFGKSLRCQHFLRLGVLSVIGESENFQVLAGITKRIFVLLNFKPVKKRHGHEGMTICSCYKINNNRN